MKQHRSSLSVCILALSALLAGTPVFADKPDWAGGGKGGGKEGKHEERNNDRRDDRRDERRDSRHDDDRRQGSLEIRFGDDNRRIVNSYYGDQFRGGNCPPGLAKKNNGCQPPGQAKKWQRGRPLPRDLQYYDLPHDLAVRLPMPPSGHRYVRVAGDILMIAVGTSMVVDALEDIGR